MNPCRKCQQTGDKNHNCGMPKSFRLRCGAVEESSQNLPKADAYSLLAEVRADIQELLKSIDEYHETFSTAELESFSRQKLDAGVKMMRLKNKVSEHFS